MRNFSEGVGKIFSRVKLKNFLQWRFVKRATNRVIEQLNVAISHHFTPRRLVLKPYFYHILIKFHCFIHRFWEKRVTNNIDQWMTFLHLMENEAPQMQAPGLLGTFQSDFNTKLENIIGTFGNSIFILF